MPELWPRSSADADSCRDSCEHWPELCKPTLITSFLPVPDKGSDTPDNLAGEAEAHPGSLVISLSHHEGRRVDRLPRQKFPKSEREKRREKDRLLLNYILSRSIRVAATFVHYFSISEFVSRPPCLCSFSNCRTNFYPRNREVFMLSFSEASSFLRATTEPFF